MSEQGLTAGETAAFEAGQAKAPRIWEAINSGNLKLLTEILQDYNKLGWEISEETAKVLVEVRAKEYDIPRFCMVCGARTKEQCTC